MTIKHSEKETDKLFIFLLLQIILMISSMMALKLEKVYETETKMDQISGGREWRDIILGEKKWNLGKSLGGARNLVW